MRKLVTKRGGEKKAHRKSTHSTSSTLYIHVPPFFPLRVRTLLSLVTAFPWCLGMHALYGKTHIHWWMTAVEGQEDMRAIGWGKKPAKWSHVCPTQYEQKRWDWGIVIGLRHTTELHVMLSRITFLQLFSHMPTVTGSDGLAELFSYDIIIIYSHLYHSSSASIAFSKL